MNNQYTEIIREKMKDFKQYYFTKDELENNNLIESSCPIEPHLMSYIFDAILGFNVCYRPFEKVNYQISFKYKEKLGCISHFKLSYTLHIDKTVENEVLNILKEVNELFEKALLEYSQEVVKKNQYSLPNYYNDYSKKIHIIEKNIEKIKRKINKKTILKDRDIKMLIDSGEADKFIEIDHGNCKEIRFPTTEICKKYDKIIYSLREELSYTIELYIDNYFSLLEHLLVLLFPMTSKYDENEEFSKYLEYDWRRKIEKLSNKYMNELDELSRIKELYRNRFAHGFFSREKIVHIRIPNYGMYPLWIGKRYCQGYSGTTNELTYEIYKETKKTFDEFTNKIIKDYMLQFNIIIAGIPSFLQKSLYKDALIDEEKNRNWIDKYWYDQDNMINMDW